MPSKDPVRRKEVARRHYTRNKERLLAQQRAYYSTPEGATARRETVRRTREKHKEKIRAQNRQYGRVHRAHRVAKSRLHKTGWSKDAFEAAWEKQSGRCPICGCAMKKNGHSADAVVADHIDGADGTKIPRGLPCNHCNRGLGLFRENAEVLRRAAEYVEKKGRIT